jgi:hypothetical protein
MVYKNLQNWVIFRENVGIHIPYMEHLGIKTDHVSFGHFEDFWVLHSKKQQKTTHPFWNISTKINKRRGWTVALCPTCQLLNGLS